MATSFARNQSRQRLADLPLVARLADRFNRRNIISIALAFWSAMTVFCGMAQSVATQALARIGVGFGESGGPPASQSIIADLFSKNERPPARGVYAIGAYLGLFLGYFIGGYGMLNDVVTTTVGPVSSSRRQGRANTQQAS
jgi:MFS family permease